MNPRSTAPQGVTTGLLAASCLASALFGIIVGYIMAGGLQQTTANAYAAADAPAAAPPPTVPLLNETELQGYRNILATDPKNAAAATALANKLYDAGRYSEAIPYYQQAFTADPRNINVSTDLGTALWYAGRPDDALAQFQKSMAINPDHAQTLFNQGIVRLEGKNDALGAIESWETLLAKNPTYPDVDKMRRMLNEARQKVVPIAPQRSGR